MDGPENKVIEILKRNEINFAATLPCDRIKWLLPRIEETITTIPLTREENGVGICAGIILGGGRPIMVIQSTGLGNMINALASLNLTYGIPLPVLASWRGVQDEPIEAQVQLGKSLPGILNAAGIRYSTLTTRDEIETIELAIHDSFDNNRPHIILISPSVWDTTSHQIPELEGICPRISSLVFKSEIQEPVMTRYDAIEVITRIADNDIIVANLGIPSKELLEIKDRDLNFYMLGSMGLASSIGLGMALAQKRHVYVIDGDGSLLMNPNALTGIGAYNPDNLTVLAIDNAAYGSTGNQPTCTCSQVDLELLARASGIKKTVKVHTQDTLEEALLSNVGFIHVIAKPVNAQCSDIPFSAKEIRLRFQAALEK